MQACSFRGKACPGSLASEELGKLGSSRCACAALQALLGWSLPAGASSVDAVDQFWWGVESGHPLEDSLERLLRQQQLSLGPAPAPQQHLLDWQQPPWQQQAPQGPPAAAQPPQALASPAANIEGGGLACMPWLPAPSSSALLSAQQPLAPAPALMPSGPAAPPEPPFPLLAAAAPGLHLSNQSSTHQDGLAYSPSRAPAGSSSARNGSLYGLVPRARAARPGSSAQHGGPRVQPNASPPLAHPQLRKRPQQEDWQRELLELAAPNHGPHSAGASTGAAAAAAAAAVGGTTALSAPAAVAQPGVEAEMVKASEIRSVTIPAAAAIPSPFHAQVLLCPLRLLRLLHTACHSSCIPAAACLGWPGWGVYGSVWASSGPTFPQPPPADRAPGRSIPHL